MLSATPVVLPFPTIMAAPEALLVVNPKRVRVPLLRPLALLAHRRRFCAQGEQVEIIAPLKAYVDAHFAGRDAADAAEDLVAIAAMRTDVVLNALSSQDARRELLLRCVPLNQALPAVLHWLQCALSGL